MASASPAIVPDQQPASKWRFVERVLSAGTGVFAVVYAAGFLIVSIHHGRYGVILFEFLRARVFAAGILLSVFIAAPVIGASRLFHLFGLAMPTKGTKVDPQNIIQANICVVCGFSVIAYVLAKAVGLL